MQVIILLLALALLMTAAYRGASVILFAPLAALLADGVAGVGIAVDAEVSADSGMARDGSVER